MRNIHYIKAILNKAAVTDRGFARFYSQPPSFLMPF